ncbi:DUF7878 domain-containing protein [Macrococcus animalis]|uniref:DUF7878 domain-containing protein n=1 Tax=Macrococcus animalis TaxID=3395467 RepID=UPI0039BEC02E
MLNFEFDLVKSPMDDLSYKKRAKPGNFMALDANLKIKYNDIVYFDEDIAIIEFWLQLNEWLNESSTDTFQYYSMEVEDEFNPFISIFLIGEFYQLISPWIETEVALVDNKVVMIEKLRQLRDDMKEVIERYIQKDISIYKPNSIGKIVKKIIEVD